MAVCDAIPAIPEKTTDLEQRTLDNHEYVRSLIEKEGSATIKRFYRVLLEEFERLEEAVRTEVFVETTRASVYDMSAFCEEEELARTRVAEHYDQMANDFFCVARMFADLRAHGVWKEEDYQSRQGALTKGLGALCSLAWDECIEKPSSLSIGALDRMQSTRRQMFINLMELSFPLGKE